MGSAKGVFKGPAGKYKVSIGHFDTKAGQSVARMQVAGKKMSFKFNQDLGGNRPSADNEAIKVSHPSIDLKPGDMFDLVGRRRGGEQAAIDYIQFEKIGDVAAPASGPVAATASVSDKLIDLTQVELNNDGKVDDKVKVSFQAEEKGWFKNTVGFYAVLDGTGAIADPVSGDTLKPGDDGYRQAAINSRISDLDMNRSTGTLTTVLDSGQILAPFIVANNTPQGASARTRRNLKNTYFAFEAANADQVAHIRSSGSGNQQTFGFEDHWNGGNKSFNDVIVSAEVSAI